MPRSLLEGRFHILRLLGEGGMGVVHAARDTERGELVAVKSLRNLGGEALLRFKQEFRALQDLRHPNLVSLGELLDDGAAWFYTMELIDGVDLLAWVGDDVDRLRAALRQLAAGLGALHAAGKVHRDIKPSNVLVDKAGRVVLVDFGLVTESRRNDVSEVNVVGTAAYMAPEQASARPVGPPADWYAVGCLLYEAMVGQLPFEGTALEVLMQKLDREPPPPSTVRGVPADLDRLCVDLLRLDPEKRPTAEEVIARLGGAGRAIQAPGRPGTPPTSAQVFVGREAELAALDDAFAEAERAPVAILIHGESGLGKSALVRQFTSLLQVRIPDVLVLEGRCYERETVRYKAVDGVIDALSRHLARQPPEEVAPLVPPHAEVLVQVFPVLHRVEAIARAPITDDVPDPNERRRRLLRAIRELFARLARSRRLVVVVDDLQWADADGLAALRELTRPRGGPPLLLICTGRASANARGLLRGVREVTLGPLSDGASRELALRLGAATGLSGADAAAIAIEAAGHPLFVDELVRHAIGHAGARIELLDDALRARVEGLPPDARRVVELLAVARAPVQHATLARAAELELVTCLRALDQLRLHRLVRSTGARRGDSAETFHDRVAAAVLGGLDDESKAERHLRLALALAQDPGVDAETLALHWAGAGDTARAVIHARQAADDATAALAFDRAARLYLQVLELSTEVDDEDLYVRLGDALVGAGRGSEAAGAYLAAAQLAPPGTAIRHELDAADQLLRSGHIPAGEATIERVLGALGMKYPRSRKRALLSLAWRRARVGLRGISFTERDESKLLADDLRRIDACWSVSIGLGVVDFVRAADFQARHLLLAVSAGEPRRVARALISEASFIAADGVHTTARAKMLIARGFALAERHGDMFGMAFATASTGVAAFLHGRWRESRDACERAEIDLRERCVGANWELAASQFFGLWSAVQMGDFIPLEARLEQLVADARARGDRIAQTHLVIGHSHMLPLAADDPERARRESNAAIDQWRSQYFQIPDLFDLWAQAQTDLYVERGRGDAAWKRIDAKWNEVESSLLLRVELIRILMTYVRGRAAFAAGDRKTTARAANALRKERAPWAHPQGLALQAALATGADRARLLGAAAEGFAAADMALHAAAARWHRGRFIGGDEGAALQAAAEAWMRDHTVRAPDAIALMLVPGPAG